MAVAQCAIALVHLFSLISCNDHAWPTLLIAHGGGKKIEIALEKPKPSKGNGVVYEATVLYEQVESPSLDVDVEEKKMFWNIVKQTRKNGEDVSDDELVFASIDRQQDPETLSNVYPTHDSVAVDWVTKKVYWCDRNGDSASITSRIRVMSYHTDSSLPRIHQVLVYEQLFSIRNLIVDPIHGYMFWLGLKENQAIERAWMDGTRRKTLIHGDLGHPNGLTVDYQKARLYWTDEIRHEIASSTLDGRDQKTVVAKLYQPLSIAVFNNYIYWSDVHREGIMRCDANNCTTVENATSLQPQILRIFDVSHQPKRINPCALNNGNCTHLCLLIPVAPFRACACPVGVRLLSDGLTCADGFEEVVILAQRTSIRVISLDTLDHTEIALPIRKISNAVALDYDPIEGFVYWSDNVLKSIRRVQLADGSREQDVIVSEFGVCDGIAVDWIGRNLYWTDTRFDRIEVARLDHSARRVLISTDLEKPRAIVVDPPRGYMYWSDWGDKPKIEKAFLDGSNRMVLINMESGRWPNGLVLDIEAGHIYWADAKSDCIERANLVDGKERTTLIRELPNVFGLSMLGDYLYWSDAQRRELERALKTGNSHRALLHDHLPDIAGIKAVNLKKWPKGSNECAFNNGGCSHLCLFRPIGKICLCPVGWELNPDGRTCIVPQAYLMFTQKGVHDITRVSLSSFPTNLDSLRLHNISQPLSLDFHHKDNRLYWIGSEDHNAVISRTYLNGSNLETIVSTGFMFLECLSVDWLAKNLYWTDSGYDHIEVARLDGQSRKIIVWRDIKPRALVVDPISAHIYWANWKETSYTIERSGLDGQNRVTFASDVGRVSSLTVDYEAVRLYWSDLDLSSINFQDLHSDTRRYVIQESGMAPYALTNYNNQLYWADWTKQSIETCDKNTGENNRTLHADLRLIVNMMAVHDGKQGGWNECAGEHHCQHLCFAKSLVKSRRTGFTCGCPTHYTLSDNGRTCLPPTNFILFGQESLIRRIRLDGTSGNYPRWNWIPAPVATLPQKSSLKVFTLRYDPLNRIVYWLGNSREGKRHYLIINRALEDNANIETLSLPISAPAIDYALDPTTQTLFWSSQGFGGQWPTINATKFHAGSFRHIGSVIANNGYYPRSLAIDPLKGFMFFVDRPPSQQSVYIQRCVLDGRKCEALVTASAESSDPDLLHVDLDASTLFWYDRRQKTVGKVDIDGRNYNLTFVRNVLNALSLTVFKSQLFIVNKGTDRILRIDKHMGGDVHDFVFQRMTGLSNIVAADEQVTKKLASSSCFAYPCSHLCFMNASQAECGCPVGKILDKSNGYRCTDIIECAKGKWQCANGATCIAAQQRCDGEINCPDGSDEIKCICSTAEFTCSSGSVACVSREKLCNLQSDCDDESDEYLCERLNVSPKLLKESHRNRPPSSVDSNSNHPMSNIMVYLLVGAVVIMIIIGGPCLYYRSRKSSQPVNVLAPPFELRLLHPPISGSVGPRTTSTTVECTANYHVSVHTTGAINGGIPNESGSVSIFDRPDLTGKSSSSSEMASSTSSARRGPRNPPASRASFASSYRQRQQMAPPMASCLDDDEPRCSKNADWRSYSYYSPPPAYDAAESDFYQPQCGALAPLLDDGRDEHAYRHQHPQQQRRFYGAQTLDVSSSSADYQPPPRRRTRASSRRCERSRRRSNNNRRLRSSSAGVRPPPSTPIPSPPAVQTPPPSPNDSGSLASERASGVDSSKR